MSEDSLASMARCACGAYAMAITSWVGSRDKIHTQLKCGRFVALSVLVRNNPDKPHLHVQWRDLEVH